MSHAKTSQYQKADRVCRFRSKTKWYARYVNHQVRADRKLLLLKKELRKLHKEVKNVGLTIVPLNLFITDKGYAKLRIALARGKKIHDKRETIKDRDNKRQLDRMKKRYSNP